MEYASSLADTRWERMEQPPAEAGAEPEVDEAWFRARLGAGVAEVPLGASAGGASDPRGAPRALDFGTQLARWVQGAGPQPVVDVAAPLHLQTVPLAASRRTAGPLAP
ncbi:unnamed protein product [Prorocentrum cordatum]|uniref:Uncharacterized protein n=1 Tax=Prorocentrum cordatum TaxID=2364126 RepID=A0ABN9WGH9_9DINO|nr:unnamed protein product [Polarella glacialis]CAK0907721.1 unnamed protein product [Polarella glacialis]